jgi:O-acetyl-ADP-ribose deacetylase (regulator of RNase III)
VEGAVNRRSFGSAVVELTRGDITLERVDAIVNAANHELRRGGGVCGAIHRAGGPSIAAECLALGGCPTGSAVATGAGSLAARHVIHAVGPVWSGGGRGEAELLASAYRASLALADRLSLESIAFPSISTGIYGYPVADAARVALDAVAAYLSHGGSGLSTVRFVLFDDETHAAYAAALEAL